MGDADKDKGKAMNEVQRLYPEVIYRFNSQFQKAWESLRKGRKKDKFEDGGAIPLPVFFSKSSRTFHWIGVDDSMWDWDEKSCAHGLKCLIRDLRDWYWEDEWHEKFGCNHNHNLKERRNAWTGFLEDQPGTEDCKAAIELIKQAVEFKNDQLNLGEMHRAILTLYSGFHQNAEEHIEGVFYKFLKECGNHGIDGRSEYLVGKLLGEKAPFEELELDEPCEKLKSRCGVNCIKVEWQKEKRKFNVLGTAPHLSSTISFMFLEHLLLHEEGRDYTDSFGKTLEKMRYIALLPLYDIWIGDRGYGGIKAVLIAYFANNSLRQDWLKKKYPKLRSAFPELAEEVRESGETLAASLPITPPYDLVRHFLKVLICVQDWDSAVVFEDENFQYGYKRDNINNKSSFKYSWMEGEKTDFDQYVSIPCSEHVIQEQYVQSDSSKHYYMWWTAGENGTIKLWSKDFIPGLSDEEANRFGNLSIRFEFPKATHIPSSNEDRKRLYQEYLRQQLDLMRMLIPKVRARRSALRNAAVSIMARNMSHNIGSHVLAAVRGDKDLEKETDKGIEKVNRLSEHLQRRMDFIAELATVEALSAADSLLFQEVLGVEKEIGREATVNGLGANGLNGQKLLLKHVSGIQYPNLDGENGQPTANKAVEAVITVKNNGDKSAVDEVSYSTNAAVSQSKLENAEHERDMVSFNSGVLGWQALYVILENIIRNVAKHAPDPDSSEIDIYLKVLNNRDHDEFFEVRIWDRRRKAGKEVRDDPNTKVVEYLAKSLKKPRFLDDDNAVTKKDWGMKEMYISAAFLRGVALSDLEGLLPQPPLIEVCAMNDDGEVSERRSEQTGIISCEGNTEFNNLGFRLWLPKAKSVAIIVDETQWRKLFGNENGNNENAEKVVNIKKTLKKIGVDFFNMETVCASGTRIPHRYGVWLGAKVIPEDRRAELPLDLLENKGMETTLRHWPESVAVDSLILNVRNHVLDKRLNQLSSNNNYVLWTHKGEITPSLSCGDDLTGLQWSAFQEAVVFDYHGHGLGENGAALSRWQNEKIALRCPPPEDVIGKFAFYEFHRGAFPQTGLFPALYGESQEAFKKEVLCAALTPVLILDERFQRIAAQNVSTACCGAIPSPWINMNDSFKMGKIWKRMRVHVPLVDECNVESPVDLETICGYIDTISNVLGNGAYVVVHQTIFEKLGNQENKLAEYLAEKAKKDGWINVVCSGRGVPWQIQGKNQVAAYRPRFIALSALLQCLEHMPSKLHLIRLLEVTRAPNRT